MRTRTLLAVALLAVLLVPAWLLVRERPAPGAVPGARTALFLPEEIPIERIDRVELAPRKGRALAFVRSGDGWSQVEPFAHPADPAAIREVIDVAAALQCSRAVDPGSIDPEARAALGLDPPAATLTLRWDGSSRTIRLGRRTVAGRAWVQVEGRPEAASADAALHALAVDGDPRQWRAGRLFDPGSSDVGRVELLYGTAPGQRMELVRRAGTWSIDGAVRTRADAEAVRGYLEALARAQVDAFAADEPEDLALFGLVHPERRVRIDRAGATPADPPAGLVEVGAPVAEGATERFARVMGRPSVVQLGTKALAALFPPPAFFVDPRGSDAVPADVRSVAFVPFAPNAPPAPAFALERRGDGWTVDGPAGRGPADPERARRLLAQLCEARAPAVAFQPMPEALRIGEFVLAGEGGRELARVRVAREPEGQWALDGGEGVLRVFPPGFGLATEAAAYAGNR